MVRLAKARSGRLAPTGELMDIANLYDASKPIIIATGLKVLGAIVIYIVGRMLIGLIPTLVTKAMERQDNVLTMVGNAKIMGGTIKNFSHNPFRRVDLTGQLDHSVDPNDAIARLKAALPKIKNVVESPAPDVEILSFNERGPVLAVRPYVHTDHYWQVYFDTNKAIRDAFGAAGNPAAEAHLHIRHRAA
jgi:small-conductance mechanosensitive channel